MYTALTMAGGERLGGSHEPGEGFKPENYPNRALLVTFKARTTVEEVPIIDELLRRLCITDTKDPQRFTDRQIRTARAESNRRANPTAYLHSAPYAALNALSGICSNILEAREEATVALGTPFESEK